MKSLKQFIAMLPVLLFAGVTTAQDRSIILEEVLVTATKKAKAEELQDVAIAATAFNENQLELLQFRDLQSLSYTIPNIAMDDIGTTKGVANFSFRGLGVNSSIPSIDPTVGVFVDGVYLGTNGGVIFDQFDLEGIEILRGPQGVLFGKNVTGGAVLINTKSPTPEFEGSAKASMESGSNKTYQVSLSGPLKEDRLLGKFAAYYNDDGGYFKNLANGNSEFGKSKTTLLRGALTYFIGNEGNSDITLKYERGKSYGDGPAAQNHAIYDRDTFDFAVNNEGRQHNEWELASATYTRDIGDGTLTNITGYRNYEASSDGDIDASAANGFHSDAFSASEQFSNELRYNILINDFIDLTAGLYLFQQDQFYAEHRLVAGGAVQNSTGGGEIKSSTKALFLSADWNLTDSVTLITGLRVSKEVKDAKIATIPSNGCSVPAEQCYSFNFSDRDTWSNFSPKVGVQWFPNEDTQLYATLTRGYRSGGYNVRNTDPALSPGPFDEEEQTSAEIGAKLSANDGRVKANVAVFRNSIDDMQRELNLPGAGSVTQNITNSADATITGAEIEVIAALGDQFVLGLNGGYLDGDYDRIKTDISFDPNNAASGPQGTINSDDKKLALPRLAEVTYGANLTWQNQLEQGHNLLARVSFNHRDESAYTDNNAGILNAADMVDALVSLNTRDDITFSVYGKNLKDEVTHGGDTQLPNIGLFGGAGASFSPLSKGKVLGASVQVNF